MSKSESNAEGSKPLDDCHALITGGSRGIGAACAEAIAGAGGSVTLVGRTEKTLQIRCNELRAGYGVKTSSVVCDVTDMEKIPDAVERARADLGPISILVNNAGGVQSAPFSRTTSENWEETLALNLTSTFAFTRSVLPDMLAQDFGRVVNIASTAGLRGYAYVTAYCAAKHGVIGMTRALARELARTRVTVNAVCPGFTDTDLIGQTVDTITSATGRSREEALGALKAMNPQGRLIRPGEVGDVVAWLCHPNSGSMTGLSVPVDGGELS